MKPRPSETRRQEHPWLREHGAWLVLAGALGVAGCRTGSDFVLRVLPDPVPRDARTGRAHYLLEVISLAPRPVRVGRDGPTLAPGERLVLERDLAPGATSDELAMLSPGGRLREHLVLHVATIQSSIAAEAAFPRPDLGGYPVEVTAGFHAANHRIPGARRALDLVPRVPHGTPIFGIAVRAPFPGRVLAVTDDAPDIPGGEPNNLIVRSADGRYWRFAHFEQGSIPWAPGQEFERHALLGRIGLSGATTGPHLHMELLELDRGRRFSGKRIAKPRR